MPYIHRYFASVPTPLELLLADELKELGATHIQHTRAGCYFDGDLETGYRVALWSRLANSVLLPIEHFDAWTQDDLYRGMQTVRWYEHFDAKATLKITFNSVRSNLNHTRYGAQIAKDAVVDQFRDRFGRRPTVELHRPDIHLNVHLIDNRATVSLDLAGDSLHRRGYRDEQVEAPLKENVAAAVLLRARWPEMLAQASPQSPVSLIDPMCGSGTLLIEGTMMAADIAPGIWRKQFGFHAWKYHDRQLWERLIREANTRREVGLRDLAAVVPHIMGTDIDPHAVKAATLNAQSAGLANHIHVELRDFRELKRPEPVTPHGLVIANLPYGERLERDGRAVALHEAYGQALPEQFPGWRASVLTGSKELGFRLGLRAERFYNLFNGAIACTLLNFDLDQVESLPPAPDHATSSDTPSSTAQSE